MNIFAHQSLGQRLLFGTGRASEHLAAEVARMQAKRVMVIAGSFELPMAQEVAKSIEVALWHTDVVMHVPVETANAAREAAEDSQIDLIVCIGGGSTTGLAKAVALTTGLPIVAIPTTYAGSEATNVWGLTEESIKRTGVDEVVLPRTVIYDAELTMSLPLELSVASGLNGIAHCVDSLWGPRADPINQVFAEEGIRSLSKGLRLISDHTQSVPGREEALLGAYLSAVSFASAGSGLHHKLCHVLGGTFDLPHAQTHATVLPYVAAFNLPKAPQAAERMARAFGSDDALQGLLDLRRILEAPKALSDYGFTESGIDRAVELTLTAVPANNPRQANTENLTALLRAALRGDDPKTLLELED